MAGKGTQPQHDGGPSSTQDSYKAPGSAGKPYKSGDNVGNGKGPKPSEPGPASQPKQDGY